MGRWLLGLISIAIIALLLALFGPLNAQSRSDIMAKSIRAELDSQGLEGVSLDMQGHKAVLSGTLETEDMAKLAKKVAREAQCKDCQNPNPKWHIVDGSFSFPPPKPVEPAIPTADPYVFSATKRSDGTVLLDGYMSSDADISRILGEAEALFPGNVRNEKLSVALGVPNESWSQVISKYLVGLSSLDRGSLTISGNEVLVTGLTTDESIRNRINDLTKNSDTGYAEIVNITVPDAPSAFTGTVQSQSLCQTLLNEMKGDDKIQFAFNSADLKPESYFLLNNLATATQQCPAFKVHIAGHTDSSGDDAYNLDLSKRRADAVSDYLVTQGVSIDKLSSAGYGEARPVASNDTPEGQSANRRIEFTVTQSE